jgi:hypothetical protein
METIVHNIRDLTGNERCAAEQLVGHALGENQQLVIQVVALGPGIAASEMPVGDATLPEWCNVYEGLTDTEIANIEKSIVRERSSRSFG